MGLIVFNYNLSLAQEPRELQAIDEWKNQKDANADAYSAGESDAIIGAEPDPLVDNQ